MDEQSRRIRLANKNKCCGTFRRGVKWIKRLKEYMIENNIAPSDAVISILNFNNTRSKRGKRLRVLLDTEIFEYWYKKERFGLPLIIDIEKSNIIEQILRELDQEALQKLKKMAVITVVVFDYGVAEVFAA